MVLKCVFKMCLDKKYYKVIQKLMTKTVLMILSSNLINLINLYPIVKFTYGYIMSIKKEGVLHDTR